MAAIVLGACVLIVGLYYLIKADSSNGTTPPNNRGPKGPTKGKRCVAGTTGTKVS